MNGKMDDLIGALEAMLFTSAEPLTIAKCAEALGNVSKEEVHQAMTALMERTNRRVDSGLEVVEVAGGFQLCTRTVHAELIRRLHEKRRAGALSQAALETLAVIAYRQPITRAEIQSIRGVDVSSSFKALLERKLIKISGRKDVPGRPFLYITTKHFLDSFGLTSIKDLPSFDERQRALAEKQELGADVERIKAIEESLHLMHAKQVNEETSATTASVESPADAAPGAAP